MADKPNRRKPIPKRLRAVIALRQNGICNCGCGEKLMPGFVLDHDPPLKLREWDPVANDTIPACLDPDHLFGLTPACHIRKTNHPLGKATSFGSDRHAIDKVRRITGEVGQNKIKRNWSSRKMESRPMTQEYKAKVRQIDRGE